MDSTALHPEQLQCLTTPDSEDPKKACVIPFKFKGVLKEGCITDLEPEGRFWCSTMVDDQLNHVSGQGKWGFCSDQCFQKSSTLTGE